MFGASSLSILLSFLGSYEGSGAEVFFAVMTGVLFWGCLILGIVFLLIVNSHRKHSRVTRNGGRTAGHRVGALSFFSNRVAAVFDIAMVALFLLTVISMFLPFLDQGITLVLFAFLLTAVYMHSLFNGVNFTYINQFNEECGK